MAQADRKTKRTTTPGRSTPGRPKKKGNQFWDIGKVGRKTGITLEDKGIRDEHGLEPVSHIFSSPVSPQRGAVDSSDAHMQESSGPDIDKTLASRKTPRLPPPRASTPRHTNIGSPKRMSTGRPASQRMSTGLEADASPSRLKSQRPNRVLDFGGDGVAKSIESPSPFKPRHTLRRSTGVAQSNPFTNASPTKHVQSIPEDDEDADELQPVDDGPLMLDGDDDQFYDAEPQHADEQLDVEETEEVPTNRKSGKKRKSGSSVSNSLVQHTPPVAPMASSKKRDRSTLDVDESGDTSLSQSQMSQSGRSQKKQRRGRQSREKVIVHQDDGDAAIDPALLAHGDEYIADDAIAEDVEEDAVEAPSQSKGKEKGKGKGKKSKAPKERDANRAMRAQSSTVQINDSPSKLRNRREGSRSLSVGPISNVHLRASTPFEDASSRTSRYGRNLIQPLKYWANEMRIYKHGETAGIIRADPVEQRKRAKPPTKKKKKGGKKGKGSNLDDIEEESETESTHPDEWEQELGVIAGEVANWDPETQEGDPNDLVREDLAFASSAIIPKEVPSGEFKFAKILTLPFFGNGVVELPPGGLKRLKPAKHMQMCFFVHEGKVMVEVGPDEGEINQFAISKGGVFAVPRGNKYSITNESRSKTAQVFFSQGCEVAELAT